MQIILFWFVDLVEFRVYLWDIAHMFIVQYESLLWITFITNLADERYVWTLFICVANVSMWTKWLLVISQ